MNSVIYASIVITVHILARDANQIQYQIMRLVNLPTDYLLMKLSLHKCH